MHARKNLLEHRSAFSGAHDQAGVTGDGGTGEGVAGKRGVPKQATGKKEEGERAMESERDREGQRERERPRRDRLNKESERERGERCAPILVTRRGLHPPSAAESGNLRILAKDDTNRRRLVKIASVWWAGGGQAIGKARESERERARRRQGVRGVSTTSLAHHMAARST